MGYPTWLSDSAGPSYVVPLDLGRICNLSAMDLRTAFNMNKR